MEQRNPCPPATPIQHLRSSTQKDGAKRVSITAEPAENEHCTGIVLETGKYRETERNIDSDSNNHCYMSRYQALCPLF